MAVEINAVYQGELHCDATHGPSGQTLSTDAPTDNGGRGEAFSPTDLVATALGTCVLTILGLVSARHDLDLKGTTVHVTKEMIQSPVRRIGRLTTVVTYPASVELDDEMRSRLESAARHCPVHQSLHPDIDAPIEFRNADQTA
ncbi:OsmC family protein [Rhodopirellula sallentina]|uniref:OsmC family protein n=1 Tax=Rhodopirellula sallentina SM41 TaxID=1263870 RepID=M5UEH6_9BACT|nr:OsmC family protein [Rhodopirellula sallentina]EMI54413.1 OsmC family protein [Rhodopirellula sallentina SM41]